MNLIMNRSYYPSSGGTRLLLIVAFAGACFTQSIQAQDGALDHSFVSTDGNTRNIYAAEQLGNGQIVVGGDIEVEVDGSYVYGGISFLNADGTVERSIPAGGMLGLGGSIGQVWCIHPLLDGKILVGGAFREFGGVVQTNLVRIEADGTVDQSFQTGTGPTFSSGTSLSGQVTSILVQPDGMIVLGGFFREYDGTPHQALVRIGPDGTRDEGFTSGVDQYGQVFSVVRQVDGKLIIAGAFSNYGGVARKGLARLHPDGSLDMDFNVATGLPSITRAVALQPDGRILISGQFTTYDGEERAGIARLNPDGSLDHSFMIGSGCVGLAGADVGGAALLVQNDGKILLGGWFNSFNGVQRNNLVRLNSDGSVDMDFDPGTGATQYPGAGNEQPRVRCLAAVSGNRLAVGGVFGKYDGISRNSLAMVVNTAAVGITENAVPIVHAAFPNPFCDKVNLQLDPGSMHVPYTIHNAMGAQVATGTFNAVEQALNLGHLPSGVYLLRAGTSGQSLRLVKQ